MERRWAPEPGWRKNADKWTDDWQIADLEPEGEHLIALLELAEELRAVVPGVREGSSGRAPVLIGVTDRRILVVGRWPVADVDAAVA